MAEISDSGRPVLRAINGQPGGRKRRWCRWVRRRPAPPFCMSWRRAGMMGIGRCGYAVSLGGDTDTVAAITGGILGCRSAKVRIGWLDRVILPDAAALDRLADGLHE